MKKILTLTIILVILMTISSIVFGQAENNVSSEEMSFGISFSLHQDFRKLIANEGKQWVVDIKNKNEVPNTGWSVGVMLNFPISKYVSTDFGLLVSSFKYGTVPLKTLPLYVNPTSNGDEIVWGMKYYYLSFPFTTNVFPFGRKKKAFLAAGAAIDILVRNNIYYNIFKNGKQTSGTESGRSESYRRRGFSIAVSLGYEFTFGKRIKMVVEPIYKRFLTSPINKNYSVYIYSYGINLKWYLSERADSDN